LPAGAPVRHQALAGVHVSRGIAVSSMTSLPWLPAAAGSAPGSPAPLPGICASGWLAVRGWARAESATCCSQGRALLLRYWASKRGGGGPCSLCARVPCCTCCALYCQIPPGWLALPLGAARHLHGQECWGWQAAASVSPGEK
jgi:hypothetical protein